MAESNIAQNVRRVQENIARAAAAAGRDPDEVTLVAAAGMVLIVVSGLAASWFTKKEAEEVKALKTAQPEFKSRNLTERDQKRK